MLGPVDKDTAGKIIQYLITHKKIESGKLVTSLYPRFESYLKGGEYVRAQESGWSIKKWADPLRKIAAILLGMDEQFLYTDEFKQMVLPEWWNYNAILNKPIVGNGKMTGRDFLQKLGTDAIRNGLHENAWVNALMSEYKNNPIQRLVAGGQDTYYVDNYPNWIITDTRFPNELAAVKERGGITIKIERDIYMETASSTVRAQHNPSFDNYHYSETAFDNAQFDYVVENNSTIEELSNKLLTILKSINYGHISD